MQRKNLGLFLFFIYLHVFGVLPVFSHLQASTLMVDKKKPTKNLSQNLDESQILQEAKDVYLYAYPLVSVVITKNIMTNLETLNETQGAPINQIWHARTFPDENFRNIVRPNLDTYYSTAFIDLHQEPFLFEIPDTENRYYLIQLLDAYTNVFASLGKRTTGTKAQKFLLAGPKWVGEIPQGFALIQAPTNLIWLIGRIQVNDPKKENEKIWALQNQFELKPLSNLGKIYQPEKGKIDPLYIGKTPKEYVNSMDISTFFSIFAHALKEVAPVVEDQTIRKKLENLGIHAGQDFTLAKFSVSLQEQLKDIPNFIQNSFETIGKTAKLHNGWQMTNLQLGVYGTDYWFRAMVAYHGLGANIVQDAIYPTAILDGQQQVLNSEKNYILHFSAEEIPKVQAFWSLTVYNEEGFLAKNSIHRFSLSDRDPLKYNKDGSLDFYIQRTAPKKNQQNNWLPTPEQGNFTLTLRAYWPDPVMLTENWNLPAIRQVK